MSLTIKRPHDMNALYNHYKTNIVVDALSRISMDSVAHHENGKK